MKYLKLTLFFFAGLLAFESNAQSKADNANTKESFIVMIDSLEVDIYNNFESEIPPIRLNDLPEPTLFILDNEELKISKFSELKLDSEKVNSISIIQGPNEIKELGYSRFNSVVKIRTEEEKD